MKILLVIDVQEKYLRYYDADLLTRINARMWRLCNLIILIIVFFQFSVVESIFEQFLFQRAQNLLFPAAYYDVSDGIKVIMSGDVNSTLVVPLLRDHRYRVLGKDLLGPHHGIKCSESSTVKVDVEAAKKWLANGAQPTTAVKKLFKQAGIK